MLPPGYQWVECTGAPRCRFLLPDGWFSKQVDEGGTHAVMLSREEIQPPEMRFETGVTINRIERVEARTGQAPSAYAAAFLAEVQRREGAEVVERRLPSWTVRIATGARQHDPGLPELRKHYLLAADDSADLLYLCFFETPASEWEQTWPMAKPILAPETFIPGVTSKE